jgi:hypothetical protein
MAKLKKAESQDHRRLRATSPFAVLSRAAMAARSIVHKPSRRRGDVAAWGCPLDIVPPVPVCAQDP